MTEPVMTYVRGKGWIWETRKPYPSSYHGEVYIELRKPNPGELSCWVGNKDEHTLDEWARWILDSRGYKYNYMKEDGDLDRPGALWATFIPLDGSGDANGYG